MCDPLTLDEPDARRKCAVSILGVVGSFALAAQFLSASINNCPLDNSAEAQCSRDVSGLIGALTACATFGSDIYATCANVYKSGRQPFEELPLAEERRLRATEQDQEEALTHESEHG